MNRSLLFASGGLMGLAVTLGLSAIANNNDAALFYSTAPSSQRAPLVAGGTATIDRALMKIVPAPYRVYLDDSVPASMALVWAGGDNWMAVLNRALAPVGLVAKPDWSKNSLTVAWKQSAPGPASVSYAPTSTQVVAAAPAVPVVPVVRATPVVSPSVMSGSFGVSGPAPVKVITPSASPSATAPAAQADVPARWSSVGQEIRGGRDGVLPSSGDMWTLMKAVVAGKQIVLTGHSRVQNEELRIRFANVYARKERESLLKIGFPARLVTLNEREIYPAPSKSVGVSIAITQGEF